MLYDCLVRHWRRLVSVHHHMRTLAPDNAFPFYLAFHQSICCSPSDCGANGRGKKNERDGSAGRCGLKGIGRAWFAYMCTSWLDSTRFAFHTHILRFYIVYSSFHSQRAIQYTVLLPYRRMKDWLLHLLTCDMWVGGCIRCCTAGRAQFHQPRCLTLFFFFFRSFLFCTMLHQRIRDSILGRALLTNISHLKIKPSLATAGWPTLRLFVSRRCFGPPNSIHDSNGESPRHFRPASLNTLQL